MLDLDETLIHSTYGTSDSDVAFEANGESFKFNVRPYCQEFLRKMSQHYSIYIFTAATSSYA